MGDKLTPLGRLFDFAPATDSSDRQAPAPEKARKVVSRGALPQRVNTRKPRALPIISEQEEERNKRSRRKVKPFRRECSKTYSVAAGQRHFLMMMNQGSILPNRQKELVKSFPREYLKEAFNQRDKNKRF